MDWAQAGAIVASFVLGAYGALKSRTAGKTATEAKVTSTEAKVTSAAAAAELLPPMGQDRPSLYDVVVAVRDGMSDLATVVRAHRSEYTAGLGDIRAELREMRADVNCRIENLEAAVQEHQVTQRRIQLLEEQMRQISPPPASR